MKQIKFLFIFALLSLCNQLFSAAPDWQDFCDKPNNYVGWTQYTGMDKTDFGYLIRRNSIGECNQDKQEKTANAVIKLAIRHKVDLSKYPHLFNHTNNLKQKLNWKDYNKMAAAQKPPFPIMVP